MLLVGCGMRWGPYLCCWWGVVWVGPLPPLPPLLLVRCGVQWGSTPCCWWAVASSGAPSVLLVGRGMLGAPPCAFLV